MISRLLILLLLAAPAQAAMIMAPTGGGGGGGGAYTGPTIDTGIDAKASTQILNTSNGNPCVTGGGGSSGITTSAANEDIFVAAVMETDAAGPPPTIASMVGGGLTWTRLLAPGAGHNATKSDAASATGMNQTVEIWWARAATAGNYNPAVTITFFDIPAHPNYLTAGFVCFAVVNASATAPQDVNASIAASGAGTSAHPTVTGVSTTATNSLLISVATSASPTIDCPGIGASYPAGFSPVLFKNVTVGSINYLCLDVGYQQVSSSQSGVSVTWTNAATWPNWLSMVTALVGPGGGASLMIDDTTPFLASNGVPLLYQ